MPMLEVFYSGEQPLNVGQKKIFVKEVEDAFREVLGTPSGRLQLILWHLAPEDTISGLLARKQEQ